MSAKKTQKPGQNSTGTGQHLVLTGQDKSEGE